MKILKKSLYIISLLCAAVCANSFAMKRDEVPQYFLKTKMMLAAMSFESLLKSSQCKPTAFLPDFSQEKKVFIELAEQNEDETVKSEALSFLNILCKALLKKGKALFNKNKENEALELWNEIVKISKKFKEDDKLHKTALKAESCKIGLYSDKIMRLSFDTIKSRRNVDRQYLKRRCKTAIGWCEKIISDKKSCIENKLDSYIHIINFKDVWLRLERKRKKEINRIIKTYANKCINEAEKFIKQEKNKENPDSSLIAIVEKYRNLATLVQLEKVISKKKEQHKIFKQLKKAKKDLDALLNLRAKEIDPKILNKIPKNFQKSFKAKFEEYSKEKLQNKNMIENKFICKVCGKDQEDLDTENKKMKQNKKMHHCSGCKKVYYCSVLCQRKDWKTHKKICKKRCACICGKDFEELEKENKTLKKCSRCKKARYCSKECQIKDWKAGHKKVCTKQEQKKVCKKK